jgi:hypothetical protein
MFAVSSSPIGGSLHATSAAAGAFGPLLLTFVNYAPAVPVVDAQVSTISSIRAKSGAAAEDDAVRPFLINAPEETRAAPTQSQPSSLRRLTNE